MDVLLLARTVATDKLPHTHGAAMAAQHRAFGAPGSRAAQVTRAHSAAGQCMGTEAGRHTQRLHIRRGNNHAPQPRSTVSNLNTQTVRHDNGGRSTPPEGRKLRPGAHRPHRHTA